MARQKYPPLTERSGMFYLSGLFWITTVVILFLNLLGLIPNQKGLIPTVLFCVLIAFIVGSTEYTHNRQR